MNDKQLKRLAEMQKAIDGGAVQPDELAQVVKAMLDIIKDLKDQLSDQITGTNSNLSNSIKDVERSLGEVESEIKGFVVDSKKSLFSQIEGISRRLSREIERVEAMVPDMPDLTRIERKIEEVESKIPVLKDTILDTPEEVRDKLETLKKDDRLDASAIKGLGKREENLTTSIVNRAIGIVDQRTSFLINKVNNFEAPIDDKVYSRRNATWVQEIVVSATPPANPYLYQLWFDIS